MQDFYDELLDQPVDQPQKEQEEPVSVWRYGITLILFPAALLRLRTDGLTATELVLGGLWSSLQFLLAGFIFAAFRYYYLRGKGKKTELIPLGLRTAVELVVLLGILQLIWMAFA